MITERNLQYGKLGLIWCSSCWGHSYKIHVWYRKMNSRVTIIRWVDDKLCGNFYRRGRNQCIMIYDSTKNSDIIPKKSLFFLINNYATTHVDKSMLCFCLAVEINKKILIAWDKESIHAGGAPNIRMCLREINTSSATIRIFVKMEMIMYW